MAMVEDVLLRRENAREALAHHLAQMLGNAASVEEANAVLAITPLEMGIERACIRDTIKYRRDWNEAPTVVNIETDFDELLREYNDANEAPLTNVVETLPIEQRRFTVIGGLKSLGMFSTFENAKAARACGEDGAWDIYQELEHDTAGSGYAVVRPSEKPFVVKVGSSLEEVIPATSDNFSVYRRIF